MTDTAQPSTDIAPGVLEALRRNALFSTLAPPALRETAARSAMRELRRGERLWTRGDPAAALAIVAQGRIKCWSPGSESREWVSAVVRAGAMSGLPSCIERNSYRSHADAMERSRVVLVPTASLHAAMDRDPDFTRRVAVAVAKEFRGVVAACEGVTLRTPLQRLAQYLASQPTVGGVVELRETQSQIAAQLGTVREVVGRGLRALEARGVVSRTGRIVRVLRPEELAAAAL